MINLIYTFFTNSSIEYESFDIFMFFYFVYIVVMQTPHAPHIGHLRHRWNIFDLITYKDTRKCKCLQNNICFYGIYHTSILIRYWHLTHQTSRLILFSYQKVISWDFMKEGIPAFIHSGTAHTSTILDSSSSTQW